MELIDAKIDLVDSMPVHDPHAMAVNAWSRSKKEIEHELDETFGNDKSLLTFLDESIPNTTYNLSKDEQY